MSEVKFKTLNELYQRVLPALRSKRKELQKNRMDYIKEEDIWNCLKDTKWMQCKTLTLYDMVDDILNTENAKFDIYIKTKLGSMPRTPNGSGDSIL